MLTKILKDEREQMRKDTALQRNPLPAEESPSRQQTPGAVEVKSNHQKSEYWVEKLQGVAAA